MSSSWGSPLPAYGLTTDHLGRKLRYLIPPSPNPRFVPLSSSVPLPVWAAILPPLAYFLALALLPPFEGSPQRSQLLAVIKFALAGTSAVTFIVLPFKYYVPGSATLSYQLGLIGCYGFCRVVDIFFLSWPRVPKRVVVPQPMQHRKRIESEDDPSDAEEKYAHADNKQWLTEPLPQTLGARLWYAFDLMISMRGIGWDYATPDVRHDTHPWQPPSSRQLRRALFKLLPALLFSIGTLRYLLLQMAARSLDLEHMSVASLPPVQRAAFVIATGITLYALFDFGYTFVSAASMPALQHGEELLHSFTAGDGGAAKDGKPRRLSFDAHNVDFFPLLNPIKIMSLSSLRSFWSKIWHRLFHRAFLIYGVLPVQHLALLVQHLVTHFILGKPLEPEKAAKSRKPSGFIEQLRELSPSRHPDPGRVLPKGRADWAKVMGAFLASGLIHAISERCALGGRLAQPPPHHLGAPSAGLPHRSTVAAWLHRFGLAAKHGHGRRWVGLGRWSASRLIPSISGGGEFAFFALNGIAVCIEGAVARAVLHRRRAAVLRERRRKGERLDVEIPREALSRPYDAPLGALWAVLVLAYTGETFVEGWVRSGIVEELTFVSL